MDSSTWLRFEWCCLVITVGLTGFGVGVTFGSLGFDTLGATRALPLAMTAPVLVTVLVTGLVTVGIGVALLGLWIRDLLRRTRAVRVELSDE